MYGEKIAPTLTASGNDYIGLGVPMVSVDTQEPVFGAFEEL